jgi:hypothetical protein
MADGIATRYGLDGPGIEFRERRDFLHPPSLLYNGYQVLPGGSGRGVVLTTHSQLAPKLNTCVLTNTGVEGIHLFTYHCSTVLVTVEVSRAHTVTHTTVGRTRPVAGDSAVQHKRSQETDMSLVESEPEIPAS